MLWDLLEPGDLVRIHWRAEPHREKWVIGRSGTAEAPIVVRSVPGPNGERPVVSGDGATTPELLDFTGEARAVIKIDTANVPDAYVPEHVVVEGLEVRSGHESYSFHDDHGATQAYAKNAAAIWVESGRHVTIRDCVIADSGNGLFVSAFDGETRDIHIERNRTFVYGNVLVEPDGAGNSQIVHYGGDSGDLSIYRKGMLHFFHNTVVSKRSGHTTLLRLSSDDETADVRDNLLYVTAEGSELALLDGSGTLLLSHNWSKFGRVESHSGSVVDVVDAGGNLEAADPGFADSAAQDFRPLPGAGPVDAGTALHAEALPEHAVVREYAKHQATAARVDAGAPDLGAFAVVPEPGASGAGAAAVLALAAAARRGARG